MSSTSDPSRPGKRHGWLFKLGVALGVLVALLVIAYFVVTSGGFIKGVILPRVGNAMNADVTAQDVSLSPWSELVITGFKLQPKGKPTLFEAEQIRARYSLWDIIRGKIVVQEAGVTGPVVTVVQNADGTSNYDPLLKKGEAKQPSAAPSKPEEKKPSTPPQVDIKNIYLKNARVNFTQTKTNGTTTAVISNLDFAIDQIQNGQPAKMTVGGGISFSSSAVSALTKETTSGSVDAKLTGAFALKFTPALGPDSVSGNARVDVLKAGGSMSNLLALATIVDCDLSLSEIRKANVRVEQKGTSLAEVRVSGPFSVANNEGHLKVEVGPIDRGALSLVGGPLHIDFNKTVISSSNEIDIKQKAKVISLNGQFLVNDFSATLTNGTTPTLNIKSLYAINVDLNNNNAVIQQLSVNGTQNQVPFLNVSLSKPMPISWGAGAGAPEEAALDLVVTNFNLADWAAFAGPTAPSGTVDTTMHLLSRKGGKQLTVDLATGLHNLGARFGSNQISGAGVQLTANAMVEDNKLVTLNSYNLEVTQNGNTAVTASGSGTVNTQTKDTDMKAAFEARIPQLLQVVKVPDIQFKSGAVRFDGKVAQNKDGAAVTGALALADLTGNMKNIVLDRLQAKFDTDLGTKGDDLQIRKLSGTFEQGGLPGGSIAVTGGLNSKTKIGQIVLQVTDVNQNLVGPFVAPALAGKQMKSISINANVTTTLAASNTISVVGGLGVTNLVVTATNQPAPAPLNAQFKMDVGIQQTQQRYDIRQFQIALSPTDRAKNQIDCKGQVDMSVSNAMNANFAIQAESIDVTPYYDQFTGGAKATNAPAQAAPAKPAAPAATNVAQVEPAAMQLPIGLATVNVNIGKFLLRQIEITNWQTAVRIETNRITVNPFQLSLNGAPVTFGADAYVGVPGYRYQVTFGADKVPLEPLAQTFAPDKANMFKGVALANATINGAGITGPSLRSNLTGQIGFSVTNAVIQIANSGATGGWMQTMLQPIATGLHIPDALSDPLNSVSASISIGNGKITVQSMKVLSAAFSADVHGDIAMKDVLTDSPVSLPVTFALSQSLAKKVPFLSNITDTSAPYVNIPDFVKLGGTLGKMKTEANLKVSKESAIGAAEAVGKKFGGSKTGEAIGAVGGLFGGKSGQSNAPAGTNAPSTNAAPSAPGSVNQLIDIFKKK